jgi:aminoglycoside 6-adenylyltransferase
MTADYEQLTERFIRWAQTEDNVRAAAVIGSRARVDHPAGDWADLDVVIFANDPEGYWKTTDWLSHIGDVCLTFVESAPDGNGLERRVLFEGGLDVDFAPVPASDLYAMLAHGFPPEVAEMVRRGVRFLVDKERLLERLRDVTPDPPV